MTHQPELLRDGPSPDQAARDAERAEYLARLREKLKGPEFRAIERELMDRAGMAAHCSV